MFQSFTKNREKVCQFPNVRFAWRRKSARYSCVVFVSGWESTMLCTEKIILSRDTGLIEANQSSNAIYPAVRVTTIRDVIEGGWTIEPSERCRRNRKKKRTKASELEQDSDNTSKLVGMRKIYIDLCNYDTSNNSQERKSRSLNLANAWILSLRRPAKQ